MSECYINLWIILNLWGMFNHIMYIFKGYKIIYNDTVESSAIQISIIAKNDVICLKYS